MSLCHLLLYYMNNSRSVSFLSKRVYVYKNFKIPLKQELAKNSQILFDFLKILAKLRNGKIINSLMGPPKYNTERQCLIYCLNTFVLIKSLARSIKRISLYSPALYLHQFLDPSLFLTGSGTVMQDQLKNNKSQIEYVQSVREICEEALHNLADSVPAE